MHNAIEINTIESPVLNLGTTKPISTPILILSMYTINIVIIFTFKPFLFKIILHIVLLTNFIISYKLFMDTLDDSK